MTINKSFKYELRLTEAQEKFFSQVAGCCRHIWNKGLELKVNLWKEKQESISRFELDNLLTKWKKDYTWLKIPPSQALQQVNKDLDLAFKSFFTKKGGHPKFKKRGVNDGFRLPQGIVLQSQLSSKIGVVKLPKVGEVRFIKSREIEGRIRFVTITRKCGKWYISFNCELEIDICNEKKGLPIGIDRGVVKFIQCSNGNVFNGFTISEEVKKKLLRLLRKLAGKKKFSSNWRKLLRKIQKIYNYIANKRKDYLHKISTQLAKNHSLIVMEDLRISNMTKSAKGTVENPGKNVKAKSGLNRSILNQGWYLFQKLIEYKMSWSGGKVVYVDPKYTSQKCSRCGHIAKENRKSQSVFKCVGCKYELNADLNASKNILAEGHSVIACGEKTLVSSMNQELEQRKPFAV